MIFKPIRLSYLDDLENDPEVMNAIMNQNILVPAGSPTSDFVAAIAPLYGSMARLIYFYPSVQQMSPYKEGGILIDPEEVNKDLSKWTMPGTTGLKDPVPLASVLFSRPNNSLAYATNLNEISKDFFMLVNASKGLIITGSKDNIKKALQSYGVEFNDF